MPHSKTYKLDSRVLMGANVTLQEHQATAVSAPYLCSALGKHRHLSPFLLQKHQTSKSQGTDFQQEL